MDSLPARIRRAWTRREASLPVLGRARLGAQRRLTPVSREYGFDRGQPVDRFYIEDFLGRHGARDQYTVGDVRGRVMEVGGDDYARAFGGAGIDRLDVLHADASNDKATI